MPRKLFSCLYLFSALLVVFACKSKDPKTSSAGDPKTVVSQFYKYVALHDAAGIRAISTTESKQAIDLMSLSFTMADAEKRPDEAAALEDIKNIVLAEAEINGDQATVAVEDTVSGSSATVSLMKVKGEWKMDLTKRQQ